MCLVDVHERLRLRARMFTHLESVVPPAPLAAVIGAFQPSPSTEASSEPNLEVTRSVQAPNSTARRPAGDPDALADPSIRRMKSSRLAVVSLAHCRGGAG